jgi:hypothetical protein
MTNLEMLRTTLKDSDRADAALRDLAIAGKLLKAATRMSDRDRAQQYFLIATSTFAEVGEAMSSLQMTAVEFAALKHAVTDLADCLRDYREQYPHLNLAALSSA